MNGLRRSGIYICNGILLSHKKEKNNAIYSNMDGTRDSHTKWSMSERQIPYDITYIWNLIYGTNKPFHRKETHGLGENTCGCQRGGSWMDWELGVNRCKLLHLEWISNEILLYSTGNYILPLGWNMLENNVRKRIYIYVWLGHFAVE